MAHEPGQDRKPMNQPPRIAVFGAGSVGCYLGGRLLAGGADVHLYGRARIGAMLARHGLHCTDLHGAAVDVAPADIHFTDALEGLREAATVLFAVKASATVAAAQQIAPHLAPGAVLISFQNGIRNVTALRELLPKVVVLAGMVPFNVLARGEGRFHQGSGGALAVEDHPALDLLAPAFAAAGLPLARHADMRAVQWGKLLLNLNNAINALSGLGLREELSQRGYRLCLAAAQREALALLRVADIPIAQLTKVKPDWLPLLLSLPDWLFRRLASQMVAIDPLARSSMWEDFEAGRPTEVDIINGEVVALAHRLGRQAPVAERFVKLVREAERGGRRDWSAPELLRAIQGWD